MSGSCVPCCTSTGGAFSLVEVERGGVERGTHRERGHRARPFAALQREPEREAGALREAADDRLAAVEAERVGLFGEQIVELGERLGVRALAPSPWNIPYQE